MIPYGLPEDAHVIIEIYDITGRLVRTLIDEYQSAGYKSVVWNGRSAKGAPVSSGIYFYRLKAGKFEKLVKMTILR